MSNYRPALNIVSSAGRFLFVLLVLVAFNARFFVPVASAADYPKLGTRSLLIGDAEPGAVTDYTISMQYPAPTTIGSIRFLLCADPYVQDPCSFTPPGDLSAASLTSQSGVTGFSILSQSANEIILTRPSAAAGTVQSIYAFSDVTNPTGLPAKFFIQIFTYTSTDGTGVPNHISSVANATTLPINITSIVPPILYFCAALTIDPWCDSVNGNQIDYGTLSPAVEDAGTSQFGVATNAVGGYVVTVNGGTMTSGNRSIAALAVPDVNTPGTPQFGLNLRANTNPALGQDAVGSGIGTVAAAYDTPDTFLYNDGDVVANAVTGTLFNTFTVTYIVNVPPDQPAGVYNTTITYICTAAF